MKLLKSRYFDSAFRESETLRPIGKIEERGSYWYRNVNSNLIKKDISDRINRYWL